MVKEAKPILPTTMKLSLSLLLLTIRLCFMTSFFLIISVLMSPWPWKFWFIWEMNTHNFDGQNLKWPTSIVIITSHWKPHWTTRSTSLYHLQLLLAPRSKQPSSKWERFWSIYSSCKTKSYSYTKKIQRSDFSRVFLRCYSEKDNFIIYIQLQLILKGLNPGPQVPPLRNSPIF